ncbi:MAG: RluA family pseudouridine synthase [Eubacteriales bacterium]
MREIKIGKNDAGQRLDKFLSKTLRTLPQSLLYKSIRLKKIKVNRHRATPSQILLEGDLLQLFLADEFFGDGDTKSETSLGKIRVSLEILYEDENILLVRKRPGMSVHAGAVGDGEHLLGMIQAYLYQMGEYDPAREQSFAPALCNRIDRNTEGIVIAAKTAEALRAMDEKIRAREVKKFYLAAVHGTPKKPEDTLRAYLIKDADENKVRVYDKNPPKGAKEILTRYRVLETRGEISLLEVELLTGRTHQIRAHLAHIGHPLLGDGKYGVNRLDRERGYSYQALCAYRLRFAFNKEETPGPLDYLDGKEISITPETVYFVKELFS